MIRFRSAWAGPAFLCVFLAAVHTWPLASAPATLSRNDNGDAQLNEWILAWVEHQLPRAPAHLFQANIFYPAKDTLTFSEPLIVPAILGAPLAWLGGSPVLVFNVMVLAGFALSALAGYALLFAWTGDRMAGLLAGATFAFNTHTLTRLAHVQGLHIYGLPLALLATDRVLSATRTRDAWWLTMWMTAMAYTSGYLLVFGAIMIAVAVVTRIPEWLPRASAVAGRLSLAAAVSALAILPLALPYRRAAADQGMVRSLESVGEYSATVKGYLAASGTIHMSTWSGPLFKNPVDSFFPGFVVIGLALVAVWTAVTGRQGRGDASAAASESARLMRRRVVMLLAIAVVGFLLSLGTRTPVYGWIYHVFPPMRGLRAAARFGNLFLLGMSALAGLGLAALRTSHPRSPRLTALAIVLIVAANLEALRAPFEYRRFDGIPRVYTLLAAEPAVVLAEVPFYPRQAVFENAEYVLNSTAHWRPLMNGYSGYTPASYGNFADAFWYFPEERAIQAMRRAGVTHVMFHPARFGHEADAVVSQLDVRRDFELMAIGAHGLRLYRLH
jgi:hypothetical protein